MAIRDQVEPLVVEVSCTADALRAVLADGREVSVPLAWFPRLRDATPSQRSNCDCLAAGWASTGPRSTRISLPRVYWPRGAARSSMRSRANRVCSWQRSYGTRGGARFARVHRAILFDPLQLKPIR